MENKATGRISLLILLIFIITSTSYAQTAWRGTNGTNWNDAGNWSSGVPTSTSTVTIGDVSYTNQPTISSTVTIAALTFNSARACTLTVSTGGAFTVTGNVGGTWTARRTHLISVGTRAFNVNGTLTMGSTASFRYRLNVTTTTGTITVGGALVLNNGNTLTIGVGGNVYVTGNYSGGGTLTFGGAGNLYLSGNNTTSGTFNRGTGTVTYNGTGAQTVRGTTYYNLIINKTGGTATLAGATTSSGTLTVSQGTLSIGGSTLTASGNLVVNGTLSGTGAIAFSGINKTLSGTGSITTTGTMTFSGGAKTILAATSLAVTGQIAINTGITVTNNGTITTISTSGITGAAATSTWVNGTNSTLNILGPLLTTGTLTANANPNTVNYNGTGGAQTVKTTTYYNLNITKVGQTATLSGATSVNGSLTINSGTLAASTYSMTIGGNFVNAGTFNGNTGSVTMSGTGTSINGAGTFNLYTMAITGSGVTLNANTSLNIANNLSTSGSGTFTHSSGGTGSVTMSGITKTISGTGIQLDDLNINGSVWMNNSISITGNLNVPGAFTGAAGTILIMSGNGSTLSGAGSITLNTLSVISNITSTANVQINGSLSGGTLTAASGTFTFNGSPSQLSGTANLYNVIINGTRTLQLAPNSILGIAGTFTITGSLDAVNGGSPNTVIYNGTGAQNVVAATYNNLSLSNGNTKTAAGALTVNGNLVIGTVTTFAAGTNTHILNGNWTNNGTFSSGTSTVRMTGGSDAAIGGSSVTTFSTLTISKNASTNTVTGEVNINAATVNVTSGNLAMGANNVTITNTRTGSGIITGTITHTHAFSNGTAYSFEGPDNTVTFSNTGTVTSVSVTVTIGSIAGFPFGGSINRQYNIAVTGSGYTGALRLHYLDGELNGNVESTMQLWRHNGAAWSVSGKTANDASNNWVEQGGLTNITNRWTISDNQNVVRWNGGTNAWNTASNWTIVQGAPSAPPSAVDIVQIGDVSFTNQPVISSDVSIKDIVFGSTQASTITLGSGGSLTVNGISGQWSANAAHAVNVGAQTLTVNGDFTLSDGSAGHTVNLNVGSGTVNITGSLTGSGDANVTLGASTVNIGGNFVYTGGTFTGGTSTVSYNGAADQIVAAVIYNNLAVSKSSGTANLNGPTTVNGNLTLSTGGTLAVDSILNISGNVNIGASAALNANASTITLGGNWTRTGVFTSGASTVVFNGTGAQSIDASTFNNVIINKASGVVSPGGTWTINGSLIDSAGTLDLGNLTANRSALGGTFRLGPNTLLRLSGAGNFPSNYSANILDPASTVEYYGTGAQTIPGAVSFGNLTVNNNGAAVLLGGSITTEGNVLIQSAGALNGSSYTIIDHGNWTNNGSFTASTGTIQLAGTSKIINGTSSTIFNNLTVSGSYTPSTGITVNGTMNITGTYSGGGTNVTISGNLYNVGTFASSGIVNFNGNQAQNITMNSGFSSTGTVNFNGTIAPVISGSSPPQLTTLNINNTTAITPNTGWTVSGPFTVASGATFNGGSATQTFNSTFTNNGSVTSNGVLVFSPSSTAVITLLGTSFNSTGTVEFSGGGLLTIVGAAPAINTLAISNNNASGVTLPAGWTIGGDLDISTGAILNGSSFNYSLNGSFNNNGTFNGESSTITMTGTGEAISGAGTTFNNLVIATGATVLANSAFNISGNLTENGALDATDQNITFTGSTSSIISGTANPITLDIISISKSSATTTLAQNITGISSLNITSGTFDIASYTAIENAGSGMLRVDANGLLRIGGTNELPAFTTYALDPASNVEYYGSAAQTVTGATYGNLLLSGFGTKTMDTSLNVEGNLNISTGTPAAVSGGVVLTLNGNWTNNGTFSSGTSTVRMTGGSDAAIGGSSVTTFSTLTISKNASTNTVTGEVNINAATVNVTSGNLAMGANNVTITNTRTGSGIITGTITHTHAFSNGTAYSFEGPDNTVTFSNTGTVTSVSVTVTIGSIAGFPFGGSINRQYNIAVTGSGYTGALRLHYLDGELNGNVESTMQLWRHNGAAWSVSGKTANDASNNWVEQGGLTNITNRWTISDNQNVVRWNGGTNAWNTASNWTIVQGAPSAPPSAVDIVQIGDVSFTNQPVISSDVSIKDIVFGSTQASTITLGSGGSLTVNGISGQWSANAAHAVNVGAQTLTVNGDFTLSDGSAGHTVNLNVGSGTVNITGSLTGSGDANVTLGASTVNIGGNFVYTGGTFTGGTSTVSYNGAADQIVAAVIYNNLAVSKSSGTANLNGPTTVNGNLTLSTGGTLAVDSILNISGNVNIGASAALNANASTITLGGNWTRTGVFTSGASTVVFNGTGAQSIDASTFNNVIINKASGVVSPGGTWTINGSLIDSAGTLDLGNLTANRSALGGTFRLGPNTLLRLSGAGNFPSNYSANILDPASTVEYYGTGAQTIPGAVSFGNLTVNKTSGDVLLNSNIALSDNLSVTGGDIDLNGNTIVLGDSAIVNETSGNTIKGNGTITGTIKLNAPDAVNAFGLGATISSTANLGNTIIIRGHAKQLISSDSSILRYYEINPETNTGLNATLVFKYDDSELDGLIDSTLCIFSSTDNGSSWLKMNGIVSTISKTVTLDSINEFSRWTLSSKDALTGVGEQGNEAMNIAIPKNYSLSQNYPNPFNPATSISFDIPKQSYVVLKIYNIVGCEVATLIDENLAAGRYIKTWNASLFSSGVYFFRIIARSSGGNQNENYTSTKKLLLIK